MPDEPSSPEPTAPDGHLLIYRDGATCRRVRLEGRTVWLSQRLIAELFQVSVKTANEHLVNIYADRGAGDLESAGREGRSDGVPVTSGGRARKHRPGA